MYVGLYRQKNLIWTLIQNNKTEPSVKFKYLNEILLYLV